MDDKKQFYIEDVRQWVRDYRQMMARAESLTGQWGALYNTLLVDDDMPDGVITDGTSQLSSFATVVGNLGTLTADYDAGIDTNFERVA